MYDSYICDRMYRELKSKIVDIINGEILEYDIEEISDAVQEAYDTGHMTSLQYDDLMGYIQDMI